MPTLEAGSALELAQTISEKLPKDTLGSGRKLYKVLVALAVDTIKSKGYSPATTHVTLHSSVELIAKTCGFTRRTALRQLQALRERGIVDWRSHKASLFGEVRNSGTVFMIRLDPTKGSRCRLSYGDLKHKHRNLEADVKAGRTSLKVLRAMSHTHPQINLTNYKMLLDWTLKLFIPITPVTDVRDIGLHSILDLLTTSKREDRAKAVDSVATALAQALRDAGSLNYFRKLAWHLLRHFDRSGEDHSYKVFLAAQRASIDAREWSELRRPGGLLVSRLRGAEWFAEMMAAPPVIVV